MRRFVPMILFLATLFFPVMAITFPDGPPAGRSGAPGDLTCQVGCHNSFEVDTGAGSLTIVTPESYTPGDSVEVLVKFADTGRNKHGFEITARDANNAFVGTLYLVDDMNTRFTATSNEYVTHNATGNQLSEWSVGWASPETDAGSVTFYAAGIAANNASGNQGDYVYTTNRMMGVTTVAAEDPSVIAAETSLHPNYPNPFAERTTLRYSLDAPAPVRLVVYDVSGRVVDVLASGERAAGVHTADFEARGLAAGLYIAELRTPRAVYTHTLLLQP